MQWLLGDFLDGDLALGGHVQHCQAHRCEDGLLHDQNRCHKSRIAQNVGGDWQADVIGIEVQRIQGADGGVRGVQVEEHAVEHQEHHAYQHGGEERHDNRGMEDVEDRFLGEDGEHQARARYEEGEPVEHHLSGRPADSHSCGDISHRNHDADNAEALHGAD